MAQIKIIKTVCNGSTMHIAGNSYYLPKDLEKYYLEKKIGVMVEAETKQVEMAEVETKEEKIVYETKAIKSKKKNAPNKNK
jgi:hypothetical protein